MIPNDLPQLVMWLRADDLALANGAAVSSWTGRSSSAFTLTQATAAKQPLYRPAGISGLPAVEFDGLAHALALPAGFLNITQNTGYVTMVAVYKPPVDDTVAKIGHLLHVSRNGTGGANVQNRFALSRTTDVVQTNRAAYRLAGRRLDLDAQTAMFSANGVSPEGHAGAILTGQVYYAINDARIIRNGTIIAENLAFLTEGVTENTPSIAGSVGARSTADAEYFGGMLAELLVFKGQLTLQELANVHSYLSDRYTITVSDYNPNWNASTGPAWKVFEGGLEKAGVATVWTGSAEVAATTTIV